LLIVIGLCAFGAYVVHGANGRDGARPVEREATDHVAELPPVPVSPVIPDTVPPAWIAAYGSDSGK
jgi:hypothetical protein